MIDELRKSIGKISSISFGFGGYQDVQFGVTISVETESGSATTGMWTWCGKPDEYTKWTVEQQSDYYNKTMRYIIKLMQDAKVQNINDLKGKPIEATWEGNWLKEIRILTEVIL